jgi:hypothetical protein
MRIFPVFFILLILFFPACVFAQDDDDTTVVHAPPSPPIDEYNNVPPGILMSAETAVPSDTADTSSDDEEDVMTMDDITAAYNKGQYDLVAKHIIPVANGNYAQAQELLGIMYHKGQGVTEDQQSAIEWLTKAAESGRPLAQHYLATMTYAGVGTPVDPVRALMWLYIAIVHYPDGPEKTRAIQDRDNVSVQLSRRDKLRAYDLAHDWLEKKGEGALLNQAAPP